MIVPLQRRNSTTEDHTTDEDRDRYGHTRDAEYQHQVELARQQLAAALSEAAIDHYAMEKLDNAERAIKAARRTLIAVDRWPYKEEQS
jgi:hypothetical protein